MEYWTKEEARQYLVAYHGFNAFPKGPKGILSVFDRLKTIQIDPVNICGRNHELVLQSRVPEFTPDMLYDQLYQKRTLIEGWEKQAAIYRMEDWPYFQRRRKEYAHYIETHNRGKAIKNVLPKVKTEIGERGPLDSTQIEHDEVIDWHWAPAKAARAALDALMDMGELVITNRNNNRKVYDLAERIIPPPIYTTKEPHPDDYEYDVYRILRRVKTVGMVWAKSGGAWLDTTGAKPRQSILNELCEKDDIIPIRVEGISSICYIPANARNLRAAKTPETTTVFLAPLDNMIWDRKFIKELFGFDYVWEVYKPADTRQYGHYVLPVLSGNRFIGRLEPVLHRNPEKTVTGYRRKRFEGPVLEIKNWWVEEGIELDEEQTAELCNAIAKFGRFLGSEYILSKNKEIKILIDKITAGK